MGGVFLWMRYHPTPWAVPEFLNTTYLKKLGVKTKDFVNGVFQRNPKTNARTKKPTKAVDHSALEKTAQEGEDALHRLNQASQQLSKKTKPLPK